MGRTLLIGSCEPFSGKSALVLGIAQQLIQSGLPIRFGKPLATSLEWDPDKGPLPQPLIDDDVRFIGETLGLSSDRLISSLHLLSPTSRDLWIMCSLCVCVLISRSGKNEIHICPL